MSTKKRNHGAEIRLAASVAGVIVCFVAKYIARIRGRQTLVVFGSFKIMRDRIEKAGASCAPAC
jgi:hypothetical protein